MVDSHRSTALAARFLSRHFLALLFASYFAAALWPGPGLTIRMIFDGTSGTGADPYRSFPASADAGLPALQRWAGGGYLAARRHSCDGRGPWPPASRPTSSSRFCSSCRCRGGYGSGTTPTRCRVSWPGWRWSASMPIAGSSTAWSQNADGDMTLSLGLVLGSTFLSPLVTPMAIHIVGFLATGDYSKGLHRLASGHTESFLAVGVLVPSVLGLAAGRLLGPARVAAAKSDLKLLNSLILLMLNYSNAAISLPAGDRQSRPRLPRGHPGDRRRRCACSPSQSAGACAAAPGCEPRAADRADVRPGDEQQRDRAGARLDGDGRPSPRDAADHLLQHGPAPGGRRGLFADWPGCSPTARWSASGGIPASS